MSVKRFPSDITAAEIRSLHDAPPTKIVADILRAVKAEGDRAVLEFEHRFSGARPPGPDARIEPIGPTVLSDALDSIGSELRHALDVSIENVRTLAERQLTPDLQVELKQGHKVEVVGIPVARAAAYVPGGRGSYPSTAVMCLTTARVAGVNDVCVISPAREHGSVDRAVAAVCKLLDVHEVYAVGGAQAVAAAAYGTQTIKPVDVLVGPGNSYVQEAKRQLVGTIGIDGVAGPSELVVVADRGASVEVVALDLLAQAEHGPDSLIVLISPDPDVIDRVIERVGELDGVLAVVLAHDLEEAVLLADEIAPEHLQIVADDATALRLAELVSRAGCLFIGETAATAFGDYVTGTNHVLPTGGAARYSSALASATFRRRMCRVSVPPAAARELADAGATIAYAEGFPMHARSMEVRASEQ